MKKTMKIGRNSKMVDIMDMEDIIFKIIWHIPYLSCNRGQARASTKKIIKEVEGFVEAQQTIACANCKGRKFKFLKEPWQVG
jgi:hypothetical protein